MAYFALRSEGKRLRAQAGAEVRQDEVDTPCAGAPEQSRAVCPAASAGTPKAISCPSMKTPRAVPSTELSHFAMICHTGSGAACRRRRQAAGDGEALLASRRVGGRQPESARAQARHRQQFGLKTPLMFLRPWRAGTMSRKFDLPRRQVHLQACCRFAMKTPRQAPASAARAAFCKRAAVRHPLAQPRAEQ